MNAIIRFICFAVLMLFTVNFTAFAADERVSDELELYAHDLSDPCVAGSLQIRVTIHGVSKVGIMKLELYNAEDGFLSKSARLRSIRDAAQDAPQLMCVNVPEPGIYGMAGYHDRDGNRKLKKKWDFTPREPYGLSNNPEIKSRRIPKWEEVAFEVGPNGADIDFNLVDLKARKKEKERRKKEQG